MEIGVRIEIAAADGLSPDEPSEDQLDWNVNDYVEVAVDLRFRGGAEGPPNGDDASGAKRKDGQAVGASKHVGTRLSWEHEGEPVILDLDVIDEQETGQPRVAYVPVVGASEEQDEGWPPTPLVRWLANVLGGNPDPRWAMVRAATRARHEPPNVDAPFAPFGNEPDFHETIKNALASWWKDIDSGAWHEPAPEPLPPEPPPDDEHGREVWEQKRKEREGELARQDEGSAGPSRGLLVHPESHSTDGAWLPSVAPLTSHASRALSRALARDDVNGEDAGDTQAGDVGDAQRVAWALAALCRETANALRECLHGLRYIGPHREMPARVTRLDGPIDDVGARGEHAASVAAALEGQDAKELDSALEKLGLPFALEVGKLQGDADVAGLYGSLVLVHTGPFSGLRTTPRDVGYGVSQVLPPLLQCASRPATNTTLVIEQPELHLHPEAQEGILEALRDAVGSGRLVLETHSDIVFRAARLLVKGTRDPGVVSMVAISADEGQGANASEAVIDAAGKLKAGAPDFGLVRERQVDELRG